MASESRSSPELVSPPSQKKLQKLCYYAQAWYLTFFKKLLINDTFQAWVHGPVNEKLWRKTTGFGYNKINLNDLKVKYNSDLPVEITDFLGDIYFTYGEYDGDALERQTHDEEPWIKARKGLKESEPTDRIISNEDMIKYYSSVCNFNVEEYAAKSN
jgi:uncharacterized phage-associated protein